MELFARHGPLLPHARQDEASVAALDVDLVAVHAGDFGGQDVRVRSFVEVDRGLPPSGTRREAVQALLDRQEIAERIPPCKGHDTNPSMRLQATLRVVERYLSGAK